MKKTDINLISSLRKNGRMALTELSRKTGLPVSTLHERLKSHIKTGLLKPNTLVDFDKIGYQARAHILLSADAQHKEDLTNYLKQHPNVNSLYRINNGWNILVECVFKTMHDLEDFLEKLEHAHPIKHKEVHYTLKEVKREAFLGQTEQAEHLLKGQ